MKYQVSIKDVMIKDVKTVSMDDDIQKAAQVMKKFKIGSVIVMGEKKVKGILTAEDIVYKHVAVDNGKNVTDIMTRDTVTISPEKTLEAASKLMIEKHVKKLPVMLQGNLVGIITATDIMKIEPMLYENLLERLKICKPELEPDHKSSQFEQCEMCSNYADDLAEIDGVWVCSECSEFSKAK
ncbi:MAG: CBS domain-containing protein [Candidatus Aenigmatarchaeota archaeon]